MELKINEKYKKALRKLSVEEKKNLEEDILKNGVIDPILVFNGEIIDGHNRYEICTHNNIDFKTKELNFNSENEALKYIYFHQISKRNLNTYEKCEIANKIMSISKGSSNKRKEVAKKIGVSEGALAQYKQIENKIPEHKKEKLKSGEESINSVFTELKKIEKIENRKKEIEKIEKQLKKENKNSKNVKDKFYDVVILDPPWPYRNGKEISYDPAGRRIDNPYPELGLAEIAQLEIPAKKDSWLFLWTTHRFLPDSFNLLKSWNFSYKGALVWNKEKMGMGHTLRMQCEFCLVATRGTPLIKSHSERDLISSPRREHSRKPDEFYEMVRNLTIGKRYEMFAREVREGFTCSGIEVNKFKKGEK